MMDAARPGQEAELKCKLEQGIRERAAVNRLPAVIGAMLLSIFAGQLGALDDPTPPPGKTIASANVG